MNSNDGSRQRGNIAVAGAPPSGAASYPLEESILDALGCGEPDLRQPAHGDTSLVPRGSVLGGAADVDCSAHAHARTEGEREPATLTVDEALAPLKPWMQRFVRALVTHGGIVELACRAGNVSRSSAFAWKARDTIFAQLWKDAVASADDLIEASLYVSAVHGNLQPIYQGGILAGYKRVKDTKAAEILLKARRPEVYAPEQVVRLKGEAKVTVADAKEVPAIVGEVIKALFAARAEQIAAPRPVLDL